jgi:tRNA C32,U32 (ribose-2'-O)-methylase TrmJ
MNDTFREFKGRIRKLDGLLLERGLGNAEFAQAVSRLRRVARRGDRSREPTAELRGLLERAESIATTI